MNGRVLGAITGHPPASTSIEARCTVCGCKLSRYRPAARTTCLLHGGPDRQQEHRLSETAAALLKCLGDGPAPAANLADIAGCTMASARTALNQLDARGHITRQRGAIGRRALWIYQLVDHS